MTSDQKPESGQVIQRQDDKPDAGRRRAVLGGGAAVLLSVKTGSALAGGTIVSPSAFVSLAIIGNTSAKPLTNFPAGSSQGYYSNAPSPTAQQCDRPQQPGWNTANCDQELASTKLKHIGFLNSPQGPDTNISQALDQSRANSQANERDLITAYLDFYFGRTRDVRIEFNDILSLWNIVYNPGGFIDGRYAGWDACTVRAYLDVWVGTASSSCSA